ncbi:MAG: PLDc N-terminal domain-containing protein [Longimicrobiales bacterium]
MSVRAVLALVILIAEAWAITQVLASEARGRGKLAWITVILLLPVLGFVFWLRSGPRPVQRVRSVP